MTQARPNARHQPPKVKVLVLAASLRAESLNRKLAALVARVAERAGAAVDHAAMRDFDVPLFDSDFESKEGVPHGALRARFEQSVHAFLSLAEAAKHYPCMKRAWVEFLGEPPGAGADRVDPVPI